MAFDTIDHDILISKLKNYGITGANLKRFKNYFTDRKQCVTQDNKTTKTRNITYIYFTSMTYTMLLHLPN